MLVFAFGSNLSRAQMRRRCPDAIHVGPAMMRGHRLTFVGYSSGWGGSVATVIEAEKLQTLGSLYVLDLNDLHALDRFEGHPFHYQRVSCKVELEDGRELSAWYYRLDGKRFGPPSERYLSVIRDAYTKLGFDMNVLRDSLKFTRKMMLKQFQQPDTLPRKRRKRARRTHGKQLSLFERNPFGWTDDPEKVRRLVRGR